MKAGGAKLEGLTAEIAYGSQLHESIDSSKSRRQPGGNHARVLFYFPNLGRMAQKRAKAPDWKERNLYEKMDKRFNQESSAGASRRSAAAGSAYPRLRVGQIRSGTGKPDKAASQRGNSDQDNGNGQEKHEEKVKNTYHGISTDKIALAIESVTDEATKLELTALLEAYMAALENKDAALAAKDGSLSELSQLASEARAALKTSLESAGFTLGSVLGWQEWKDYGNSALSVEAIAATIAALDETDANKAALSVLLAAYQEALSAAEAGTEENEEALQQATEAAREALLEALYESGIFPLQETVPEELPEATPEVTE